MTRGEVSEATKKTMLVCAWGRLCMKPFDLVGIYGDKTFDVGSTGASPETEIHVVAEDCCEAWAKMHSPLGSN